MSNAAEATSKGFEQEATAKVSGGLEIFASVGYNITEFDSFQDYKGNYEGNTNPHVPKYNFHLGAQYRSPQGYYARADFIGYGKTYFDIVNYKL